MSVYKNQNLKDRNYNFSKLVMIACRKLEYNIQNKIISDQLIRASLSVSLNYIEADNAESLKDFIHKIGICRKESAESHLVLSLLIEILKSTDENLLFLKQEAKELNLIFNKIHQKLRKST